MDVCLLDRCEDIMRVRFSSNEKLCVLILIKPQFGALLYQAEEQYNGQYNCWSAKRHSGRVKSSVRRLPVQDRQILWVCTRAGEARMRVVQTPDCW
jgi:hypothetical protein